jgi:hypothetical protein
MRNCGSTGIDLKSIIQVCKTRCVKRGRGVKKAKQIFWADYLVKVYRSLMGRHPTIFGL